MRLWHYKLIPYLPNSQLIAQWRELNSIFAKQPKHILINYVYEYPKENLHWYTELIINEMNKRNFNYNLREYFDNYFNNLRIKFDKDGLEIKPDNPYPYHHTNRYLLQCFYNLQEKYDRGQKGFDKERYKRLVQFMDENLAWSEIDFYEEI